MHTYVLVFPKRLIINCYDISFSIENFPSEYLLVIMSIVSFGIILELMENQVYTRVLCIDI